MEDERGRMCVCECDSHVSGAICPLLRVLYMSRGGPVYLSIVVYCSSSVRMREQNWSESKDARHKRILIIKRAKTKNNGLWPHTYTQKCHWDLSKTIGSSRWDRTHQHGWASGIFTMAADMASSNKCSRRVLYGKRPTGKQTSGNPM